jgi:outer membrane lipoprotein-sorting protein
MNRNDRFEETVGKDLEVRAGDRTYERMHRIVLAAHGSTEKTKSPTLARRLLMDKPVVRLAIAAAIIAAVTLGLFEFLSPGGPTGVVWADVARNVETSRGVISRMRQTQTLDGMDRPIELYTMVYSSPLGSRMENYQADTLTNVTYSDYESGKIVSLLHGLKQYARMSIPSSDRGNGGGMDPKAIVRDFLAGDYEKLGRRTIEGVETEGIEVTKIPNSMANFQIDSELAQLWVSVETGYPVMLESTTVGNGGKIRIEMIIDHFQWDVQLDPSQFRVEIPSDYTLMETPQQ